jgi:hypothetical protein
MNWVRQSTKDSSMPHLPKFVVVVWTKKTAAHASLREELIGLAGNEPEESTEYEGMIDFHWGFDNFEKAEEVAEALRVLCQKPDLVLLRLANYDDPDTSVTFKEERHVRH